MRFWLTKNSELPIHEQLVRQVMLAILSEDLPVGKKLPSIRALAQRYRIHSNTVSAAYHELVERGWLESRRGSGLYVRPLRASAPDGGELDILLAELLRAAHQRGHEPKEVLRRLEQLILPRKYTHIAIVEPEPGMREILQAEIAEHLTGVQAVELAAVVQEGWPQEGCLVTALTTRAEVVREQLPRGTPFSALRLRSVRGSLEGETRPAPNSIIAVVSKSEDFRKWSRTMLIAVGLDPECLGEIDPAIDGWLARAGAATLIISDVVAVRNLPADCPAKVFRVVADSCIAELKQLCGL